MISLALVGGPPKSSSTGGAVHPDGSPVDMSGDECLAVVVDLGLELDRPVPQDFDQRVAFGHGGRARIALGRQVRVQDACHPAVVLRAVRRGACGGRGDRAGSNERENQTAHEASLPLLEFQLRRKNRRAALVCLHAQHQSAFQGEAKTRITDSPHDQAGFRAITAEGARAPSVPTLRQFGRAEA
jgi:hypothetical protein